MKMLFAFLILLSFSANADEYKAPEIKLGLHPHSEPTIKGDTKWDEENYKVQETQEKDRALASEEEEDESTMLGRNPSSKKGELAPEVQYWKWEK
ncbi:MAG: hypothetical protein CME70_05410 [Halobacteriovorax sp.]|nr:hypothetical protein [Halobacteriovorax sp.]|tara:strand:- start:52884 stop:53168 length:285 start_codon:yes stop_codon:yes gene_type:complete